MEMLVGDSYVSSWSLVSNIFFNQIWCPAIWYTKKAVFMRKRKKCAIEIFYKTKSETAIQNQLKLYTPKTTIPQTSSVKWNDTEI